MNKTIKTHIIPKKAQFVKIDVPHELHLEAICVFAAIGFFLDDDTYWKDKKVLPPGSNSMIDESGFLVNSKPWFKWHSSPRDISFKDALGEFTDLFESIIQEQTQGKRVILPLSGGIDSRTQATALHHLKANVNSYSYEFEGGYAETKIALQIANACDFEFRSFSIPRGYLWNEIDVLSELNQCYSDFTNPRQMAIYDEYSAMGDVFSLGHWGDVLFDSMGLPELSEAEEVKIIINKLLKRGGLKLASDLWNFWQLDGSFESYFKKRIETLIQSIKIESTNAKLRAFKSRYWAPRWTSVNLSVFSAHRPITLPYYDNRMCKFICGIPEDYLKDRKLQIAYIRSRNPKLASITWQEHRPFNLNTFKFNKAPFNVPYRVIDKLRRMYHEINDKPFIQRNWELQLIGTENKTHLERYLFDNGLDSLISKSLLKDQYDAFNEGNTLEYAHPINILLVLSKFNEKYKHA